MELKGCYLKKVFFNEETGQSCFLLKPESSVPSQYMQKDGTVKVFANDFCLDKKFIPVELSGEFETNDYGVQFNAESSKLGVGDRQDTLSFLKSLGTTLTQRQLQKLLDVTGCNVFDAASKDAFDVAEEINVEEGELENLFRFLRSMADELELFRVLKKYGGGYNDTLKILKEYPDNAMEVLKENPYDVMNHVKVPLTLIDNIAIGNGFSPLCRDRVEQILMYCMRKLKNGGNVYVTFDDICKEASKHYDEIPKQTLMGVLLQNPYIVKDEKYEIFYEKKVLKEEKTAAKNFARIMRFKKDLPWHPEYIPILEKEQGYEFGDEQRQAFMLLKTTGFKLLTGDPGTGKTSTLNGLLRYLEMLWKDEFGKKPEFALCAPSGRAAQRMKETTGRTALTIHKLIEYQPYGDGEYCRDAANPLTADVVVIDESSMMGLSIFSKLLGAIKNDALVLMIGDTNQLQSVDPGNVLQDVISCGRVDSCHLTQTFRQAADSCINENARRIMHGYPNLTTGKDFDLVTCEAEETMDVLKAQVSLLLKETDASNIQVLSPVKAGSCGVLKGNKALQELLNPGKGGAIYGQRTYRIGDRVIMTANNYAYDYFNGDIGYVTAVGEGSMNIRIGDANVALPKSLYGDMDLAYVTTVHKSQGSEYDYVIIVLQKEARGLLDRNLFYTAVTRGKKKVVVVAENGAVEKAVSTYRRQARKSLLAERINDEMSVRNDKRAVA